MARKSRENVITPEQLVPASYNPRTMDDETRKGLKKSIEEFDDISGITWNKTTGNIVTGHHRWQSLLDLYGAENLEFKQLTDHRIAIYSKDGLDTGFLVRVVEWDELKEKAANVTANSKAVAGEFNVNLEALLSEIKSDYDSDLFSELRLDQLFPPSEGPLPAYAGSGPGIDSQDWSSDIGRIGGLDSNDKAMSSTVTVVCKQDDKEKVLAAIGDLIKGLGLDGISIR